MMRPSLAALTVVAGFVVSGLPATATEEARSVVVPESLMSKVVTPTCSGGVVYDDGTLNNGYALGPGEAGGVTKFDLPAGTTSLDQMCVCLFRESGAPSSMTFDLVVYNNNGSGGGPGTLLAQQAISASSISTIPTFFNFNLTGLGIAVPDTSVFVGILWQAIFGDEAIFICGDTSSGLTQRSNYFSSNGGASWVPFATAFPTSPNNPRTLGIRVDPHITGAVCVPSSTAMCLNNNRFKVQATFATASQPTTPAQTVELTNDSGYLWFFNADNIELVVKVLNACGVNNRYWVFAAGLTNVRVDITVTDTQTGATKTYSNPLNTPFQPLQDTSAFATCP
jgi:hypothetical protein